ncbi:hypothetical protein [Actinomadura bangladeshensis]|uniref:Uncharacterized protein n=1 Tax=Actinomadura bangladeshensis TaxID=453573 RepID=A0A6L9QAG4_9ACTN|nr:hypothetical protein [Actinomadura bangladeshensis]NEA22479.1 hypothetical protein [Actinomadura bangladeshensis]
MKSRRPARRGRRARLWGRIAGYTGTLLLVAAAVIVLLVPLMDDGKKGAAGAQGSAGPSASALPGQPGAPGASGLPVTPTNPVPQQNGGGQPYPSAGTGGQGGGPQIPQPGGGGASLDQCPDGTAFYRATATGVDVLVTVSASGLIRAELIPRSGSPKSQQASANAGRPHTFHFTGVAPGQVGRVKITTVSVGGGMQSCYARAV